MRRPDWPVLLGPVFAIVLPTAGCRQNPSFCDSNTPCADPTMICIARANQCVPGGPGDMASAPDLAPAPCNTSAQCDPDHPSCVKGLCAGCSPTGMSADCSVYSARPLCGPAGACVECLNNNDCITQQKTCDLQRHACAPCTQHSDCATGVCKPGGACAGIDEVYYVDNHNATVADCKAGHLNPDGKTRGTSFCDVVDALMAAMPRPYVSVTGSSQPYGALTLAATTADLTVSIIGPGKWAMPPATLSQSSTPALALSAGNSKSATVVIDGMELVGSNLGNADGVDCAANGGSATLTIVNSSIHGSGGPGLFSNNCALTLDADLITANQGGGVSLGGATMYQLTNNFIVGNASTGVTFANPSAGVFQFNTVAGNGPAGTGIYGGIDCGAGLDKRIESSIIFSNTPKSGTQIAPGSCVLSAVVTGIDAANPGNSASPDFKNITTVPFDYHLAAGSANNRACCVDKVSATVDGGAAALPDHDVDGSHRPKGRAWDIGAHEVE
jgi:hypothetical protein